LASGCAVLPDPISEEEFTRLGESRLARLDAEQVPVTAPIDLHEAMARALKYNLDHRVEEVQAALRLAELDLAHYEMLPKAVANSGYFERDSYDASSSYNLITRTPNFGASTSQERRIANSDSVFSWHILDFGLSYVRARQAADKALIAEETRRRVMHRVIEDVRSAFWRAASSERLHARLKRLEARAAAALRNAREVATSQEVSAITALTQQRELVEIRRTLKELGRDVVVAKSQLASLMNLKPGTKFTLAAPVAGKPPRLAMPVQSMVHEAVSRRPELRENAYQRRINEHERDIALLELLPGIQIYAGGNYDSNDFLLNNHWLNWGAKASWNLIKVFQLPARREVIDGQDALIEERAMALTMAVMTQVHVSRARFVHLTSELATAEEFRTVQSDLVEQIRAEAEANRVSEQTLIREELGLLVAEAKRDLAHASVEGAYANCLAAMGLDPDPSLLDASLPLAQLKERLKGYTRRAITLDAVATAGASKG
jgi:outer membrane protein TolC